MRVSYDEMYNALKERLLKYGANEKVAEGCAKNLTENSQGGVYSHGLNRFPRVIAMLKSGVIKPDNAPQLVQAMGAFEIWDGNQGMGNTNAEICMDRAIEMAKKNGVGCVALRNTNHWQRGGAFGIQAAKAGCVGICWTNTQPNMPAWGAKDRHIGNNPLVMCLPYKDEYVMVDGAMAQFSYGAIESARLEGRQLPVVGGYDQDGNLTTDPAAIEKTWRVLPIGFWKGSGFSIMMDMIGAALSDGKTVSDIGQQGNVPEDEYNLTQVFMAISMPDKQVQDAAVARVIEDIKSSQRVDEDREILYPCEKELDIYHENVKEGIPVNEKIWAQVLAL
ncbi:3-dehydro-L-gulonate 2-dehydrogenase [Ruminococcaceae bacterium OttesenSCG-928-A16]|nr:3-dehydro-L-gulonate 2-dehydrogenase [Ruminococcaceae bacterium OttesenSCG-928-A16]